MSTLDSLASFPMDKLFALIGVVLLLVGTVPFCIGAYVLVNSPAQLASALTIIGAGGSICALGVMILTKIESSMNSSKTSDILDKVTQIVVCQKPSSQPPCIYQGTVEVAGAVMNAPGVNVK